MNINKEEELLKKMAKLESMNDQLVTELANLDRLMRAVGFTNGLETVKATAMELLENGEPEDFDEEAM